QLVMDDLSVAASDLLRAAGLQVVDFQQVLGIPPSPRLIRIQVQVEVIHTRAAEHGADDDMEGARGAPAVACSDWSASTQRNGLPGLGGAVADQHRGNGNSLSLIADLDPPLVLARQEQLASAPINLVADVKRDLDGFGSLDRFFHSAEELLGLAVLGRRRRQQGWQQEQ